MDKTTGIIGEMLREAVEKSGKPAKAVACEIRYSVDTLYAAFKEKRQIPKPARRQLAKIHPLAGLALALDDTGYNALFQPIAGDQHPQNMLQRVLKEDRDADDALRDLPELLIDKIKPGDLPPGDKQALRTASKELIEEARAIIYLVVGWEDAFKLGILDDFFVLEKSA